MTFWEGHFDWRGQFGMARSRQKRALKLLQEGCSLTTSRWVPVTVKDGRLRLCKEENELVRIRSFCTRVILTSYVISAAIEVTFKVTFLAKWAAWRLPKIKLICPTCWLHLICFWLVKIPPVQSASFELMVAKVILLCFNLLHRCLSAAFTK